MKKIPQNENGIIKSFEPVYDKNSKILILGTMPSPASLKAGMYYSHPQNSFWKILINIIGDSCGFTNNQKKEFLLKNRIALWDTLKSCERMGALDSNIKNFKPNDIASLVQSCPGLRAVFLNGSPAFKFYKKFHAETINLPFFLLPSTSPANCRYNFNQKLQQWNIILNYLN